MRINTKYLLDYFTPKHPGCFSALSLVLAFVVLVTFFPDFAIAEDKFDDKAILDAYCDLLKMSQTAFGALFALAAGVGAIVAAAFGMYRSAISFFVVSLAYFAIPAMINLSFGSDGGTGRELKCEANSGTFEIGEDDIMIRREICDRFQLIEGSWGALIFTIAGIVSIVSVAVGAYRAGYTLIFVGCGAFILRSLLSLFYGEFDCEQIYADSGAKIQEFFQGNSGG